MTACFQTADIPSAREAGAPLPAASPVTPAGKRSYRLVWRTVLVVGLFQAVYAAVFIHSTSFVIEGQRCHCLFDDAMISMQHAANWAKGHGFVWYPGVRVEGYSNFLWTAFMGLLHLLPFSPGHLCLLAQILGVPVLWACLIATAHLAQTCRLLPLVAAGAVVLTGTYYPLLFFSLWGMETGALACLVTFALAAAVRAMRHGGGLAAMLWFAPALLLRQDAAPVVMFVFGALLLSVPRGRARLALGLLIVVLVAGLHLLWRHSFYGEWLPNTYYLKLTNWPLVDRLQGGLQYSFWTAASLGIPFFLGLISLLLLQKRWQLLLLGVFASAAAYQVYTGGDAWRIDRFMVPVAISLFLLASDGAYRLASIFVPHKRGLLGAGVRIIMLSVAVVGANALHWQSWLLLKPPQTAAANRTNLELSLAIRSISSAEATVGVGFAGAVPYFSDRRCYDFLGKVDAHVARLPVHAGMRRPGHNKWDYEYTIQTYQPDIVIHCVPSGVPDLLSTYVPAVVNVSERPLVLFLRRGSPHIHGGQIIDWHQAEELTRELRRLGAFE